MLFLPPTNLDSDSASSLAAGLESMTLVPVPISSRAPPTVKAVHEESVQGITKVDNHSVA